MENHATETTESNTPAMQLLTRKPRSVHARATSRASASTMNLHAFAPWALVAAVVILALAVLGVIAIPGQKSEAWQAVFLTNGQAYFGHVARVTPNWLTLRDVHYMQTTTAPVQGVTSQQAPANIALVKLGNELHGPMNEMRINREHVLFTEVLRDDSAVVRTIVAAQTQPEPADSRATAPVQSPPPQE